MVSWILVVLSIYSIYSLSEAATCKDKISTCKAYVDQNYCKTNGWVQEQCKLSCGICGSNCKDTRSSSSCRYYKRNGYCNTSWMKSDCKKTCNYCGTPKPTTTTTTTTTTRATPSGKCKDEQPSAACISYKQIGYCATNSWIQSQCKRTCNLCGGITVRPATATAGPPPGGCGTSNVPAGRVIAGQNSKSGQWPWQVAINRNGYFRCGGTLIARNWVLTAAHCFDASIYAYQLEVVLGDLRRDTSSGIEQKISVSRIVSHYLYGNSKNNNDIALLKLSRPAILNSHVNTACLPRQGSDVSVGTTCYISGWGKIQHPVGLAVNELRHAKLSVISNSICKWDNDKIAPVTSKMVCAKGNGRQSGCHGDSGGPFVCQGYSGSWTLQGVISWGSTSCDSSDANSVFARVSEFRDWIDEKMRE